MRDHCTTLLLHRFLHFFECFHYRSIGDFVGYRHKTRLHIGQLVKDTSDKLKQASEIDHHADVNVSFNFLLLFIYFYFNSTCKQISLMFNLYNSLVQLVTYACAINVCCMFIKSIFFFCDVHRRPIDW